MDTKVYINGTQIDLSSDISIPTTFSVMDIREPDKRTTYYSKTVVLPSTHTNDALFGNLWNINATVNSSGTTNFNPSFNPNYKASAVITYKDVEQFTGIMQLLKINNKDNAEFEYEVSFLGALGSVAQDLLNKSLAQLDLSEYNHTYDRQTQMYSWSDGVYVNGAFTDFELGLGYVYPMIDYGMNDLFNWNVEHFFPAVYVKTIWDKMISQAGYEYVSPFMDTTLFKSLIITDNSKKLVLTNTQIRERTFRAESSGTTSIQCYGNPLSYSGLLSFSDDSTLPNFDDGSNYNSGTSVFTVPKGGTYTFRVRPKVTITHTVASSTTLFATSNTVGWVYVKNTLSGTVLQSFPINLYDSNGIVNGALNISNGGTSVVNGVTTSEYTGELAFTVPLLTGDTVQCEFHHTNGQIYSIGLPSATNYATVNMNSGSVFMVQLADVSLRDGDTVDMNTLFSDKYKQIDFFNSICKMFNLIIEPDKTNPRKLYIEPDVDYSQSGQVRDWCAKLDYSKPIEIIPLGELNIKRFSYKYKDDGDYFNNLYQESHQESYGTKIYDIENDFLKNENKTELIFSPTPLVDTLGQDRIISKIYTVDETGTIKPKPSNLRILYYGGVLATNQFYNYIDSTDTLVVGSYAYAGHLDNPTNPTFDLSFGVPKEVYYLAERYTANNLFNIYLKKKVEQIADKDSKIFRGYFHLNEIDINQLDFSDKFYFEGEFWALNKIPDFDIANPDTALCEFVKLKEVPGYVQDTGVVISGGSGTLGTDTSPQFYNRVNANNNYGQRSNGSNNSLPTLSRGINVTGTGNVVGEGSTNVIISGNNNRVDGGLTNVTLINTSDVTVTESNTMYHNGVLISAYPEQTTNMIKITVSSVGGFILNMTENHSLVVGDCQIGQLSCVLPDPADVVASQADVDSNRITKIYTFIKIDSTANTVVISPSTACTIQGLSDKTLTTQYEKVSYFTDGTNWYEI